MPLFSSILARRTFGYLVAGALVLLGIVFASLWLTQQVRNHAEETARAREIRTLDSVVMADLLDAETGQRGYLLTQAPRYLQPYEAARLRLVANVTRLRQLMTNDADALSKVDRLVAATNNKLAELAESIRLQNGGQRTEALALVNTDRGKILMDQAREILTELIDTAEQRVTYRLGELDRAVNLLTWSIGIGSLLIVIFTAGAAYTIMLHTRDLIAAQQEVTALNVGLEGRVKERTAALTLANDEIQRFAYIVSHDLRSPLVNIMGFTSELETSVKTLREFVTTDHPEERLSEEALVAAVEDVPEALRFIRASTGKMDGLINAILKLSREGRRDLNPEVVDLVRLFTQVGATVKHQLDEAGAELSAPETAPTIFTDRLAIEQVIGNLLDNAVKYLVPGRPGRIVVTAEQSGRRIHIVVTDNGRGIAPQDHERIFELFRRAGTQDRPGEGIGLAHVRALVRRLGGEITVRSELGRGSAFQLDLPGRLDLTQTT
jgi:signal transduction histidine kinase